MTRDTLASRLRDYLQHRSSRAALVDWAEQAMMEEEFDDRDLDTIRDITIGSDSPTYVNLASPGKIARGISSVSDIARRWMSFRRDRSG